MKSKFFLTFCASLSLAFSVNAQVPRFCDLCTTIDFEHMSKADFDLWVSEVYLPFSAMISADVVNLNNEFSRFNFNLVNMRDELNYFLSAGLIDAGAYESMICYCSSLDSFSINTASYLSTIEMNVQGLNSIVNSVPFSNSVFCVECTATGGGGSGSCALCPNCEQALQMISASVQSIDGKLSQVGTDLQSFKTEFHDYYVKWQAQDDKLQPLIDELKPMLANIKKYYDDYYGSGWDGTTWSNQKKIINDMSEADLIVKWGRFFGDYVDSTFSKDSWNSLSGMAGALDWALNSGAGEKKGKDGLMSFLMDYQGSKDSPLGDSYTKPSEVLNETEYMNLNWFQRVTAALGILAFPDTNVTGKTEIDFDKEKAAAEGVQTVVTTLTGDLGQKMGITYNSFKAVFTAFKGIIPADQLPTSVQLHPGFRFDLQPPSGMGGAHLDGYGAGDGYVLPPFNWTLEETPTFKTALDVCRGVFGFVWWVLGFGILYEIVVGVYGFIVMLTQKAMAVFGSLGRSGGGAD